MINWVLPATSTAFLWAISDITTKYMLNAGINYKATFVIGALLYVSIAIGYFLINKDCREKVLELNELSFNKKITMGILFLVFGASWAIGELLIDYAYSITDNIGYVRVVVVTSALLMYLYSIAFMGAEFNKLTFLGILLVFSGIYLIITYSKNN